MAEYKHPYLGWGPGCESAEWKKCSSKLAMICKCQRPDWTKKGRRSEWSRDTKRWNLRIIMHLNNKSSFYIRTLHGEIWKTDMWAIYYAMPKDVGHMNCSIFHGKMKQWWNCSHFFLKENNTIKSSAITVLISTHDDKNLINQNHCSGWEDRISLGSLITITRMIINHEIVTIVMMMIVTIG